MRNYRNGAKCVNGPPHQAGAYENWNWCSICHSIYEKTI